MNDIIIIKEKKNTEKEIANMQQFWSPGVPEFFDLLPFSFKTTKKSIVSTKYFNVII